MRIYALQQTGIDDEIDAKLLRTLKPHTTPVVTVAVDSTSSLLATGGADGVVKVWDIRAGFVTHTFHGHSGVVSALSFFQADSDEEVKPTKSKKRKSRQRDDEPQEVQSEETSTFRLALIPDEILLVKWAMNEKIVSSLSGRREEIEHPELAGYPSSPDYHLYEACFYAPLT